MWKPILWGLLLILAGTAAAAEQTQHPLLMQGKQSLFQRVLAKPGTRISSQPGAPPVRAVTPFSVFYVYAREKAGDADWLQVGLNSHGSIQGWLPAAGTIEWSQGLTVAFRDPAAQDRVLLFRDRAALKHLVDQHDLKAYDALYNAAESGRLPADSPVVAMQPDVHVDILRDFYLVPIRRYEEVYLGSERARMLEVSTVPLESGPAKPVSGPAPIPGKPAAGPAPIPGRPAGSETKPTHPFRAGIVFVIDSTLSMEPYIQRTRAAVRRIYDSLERASLSGDLSFGLVAFRDNTTAVPGLEYLTRTYATLAQGRDATSFFKRVDDLQAATISSQDFIEDPFSGIRSAIEGIDWRGQDARYIVLITDAGPRHAEDPLSGTHLSAQALRRLAQDKGIAISVLHLLTPQWAADHASAEAQYRELSRFPGIGELYYGVETGDLSRFGQVLDALAGQIAGQVRDSASGAPPQRALATQPSAGGPADTQLAELQAKVAKLGYALRMRYLQHDKQGHVPSVFNAWMLDRDFRNPQRPTLDVRVLLTRDQLSDLHYVMRQVLQTAEEGLLSPRDFLNDLKSLAVTIARDPERLALSTRATGAGGNLADLGFMREYLEGLPYTGEIMSLSLEDWQSWPAKRQLQLINSLEEKLNYYQALHDHTDLWIALDGGPVNGDSVFPIALEMLP